MESVTLLTLPYADAPERVTVVREAGKLRVSLPVTPGLVPPEVIVLEAATVVYLFVASARSLFLRSVALDVDGTTLTASAPGRTRLLRWDCRRIRKVGVRRFYWRRRQLALGQLTITNGFEVPTTVATGYVTDLERVACELRIACCLPPEQLTPGPSTATPVRPPL